MSEPQRIDCAQACEMPDGVNVVEVPRPRHDWGDVFTCPNDGCGRSFLATTADNPTGIERP